MADQGDPIRHFILQTQAPDLSLFDKNDERLTVRSGMSACRLSRLAKRLRAVPSNVAVPESIAGAGIPGSLLTIRALHRWWRQKRAAEGVA